MTDFLLGATTFGCLAAAVFFLRFWRDTGDRFFGWFALAFSVFAVNRFVLLFLDEDAEARTWVYVVRFIAFGLIAFAILDKNRADSARAD